MAICHDEDEIAILDCLVEQRAPFNPTAAVADMAKTLASYRLSSTTGDRYAANWIVDAFAKVGVTYEHSERNRSEGYLNALPLFTAGRVRPIDNPRLVAQFAALERRTTSLRDIVDHGPGGRDDCANSVALVLSARASGLEYGDWIGAPEGWDSAPYFSRIGGLARHPAPALAIAKRGLLFHEKRKTPPIAIRPTRICRPHHQCVAAVIAPEVLARLQDPALDARIAAAFAEDATSGDASRLPAEVKEATSAADLRPRRLESMRWTRCCQAMT